MLERTVERRFTVEGATRDCWVVKMTPVGFVGFPDRIVFAPRARVGFAELKRPGELPRAIQLAVHRRLRRLGFLVEVIDDPSQIPAFYDRLLA